MLMEELFSRGIMTMGPSRIEPTRQIGVFNSDMLKKFQAMKAEEMEKFRWIEGDWNYENKVPATRFNPAYADVGPSRFAYNEKDGWIEVIAPDGRQIPNITFDPFSRQWMYVLTRGAFGILRSAEGWVSQTICFTGLMTMLGLNCDWRMTWTKAGDDDFGFVNEEGDSDGGWVYIDEWRFKRAEKST
jgi:hypothetical protein